jgi:hypothetical protein
MGRIIIGILFIFLIYKGCDLIKKNGYHIANLKTRTSEIYSLKVSSEVNGQFVLGIGSLNGEDYYVFYRKTTSGGLIREKIRTSDCILYEGYPKPKIIEVGQIQYHLVDGDTVSATFSRRDYSREYHSIYIPKGTITERINDINIK